MEAVSSPADGPERPSPSGARRGCRTLARASSLLVISVVACCAIAAILALVGAFGYTQIGPGGVLSDVRSGKEAPDFALQTLDGNEVHLSDFRGRPVMLNFWATFCPKCVRELPIVAAAEADHADVGLAVLAVDAGQSPSHVQSFLELHPVDLRVVLDPDKAVYRHYRVVALPTTIWLDRNGIVRAVEIGPLTGEIIARNVESAVRATDVAESAGQ